MKNTINYYYNLNINTIHQKEKNYYFNVDKKNYFFLKCDEVEDLDNIYSLNMYLIQFFPIYKIILNTNGEIITNVNNLNYILLEINNNKNINLNGIIELNNINVNLDFPKLRRDDWYSLWTNKIDYLEYQLSQMGKKYPLIRESFNYYVGLAENAISLVNTVDKSKVVLGLSHRRIRNYFDLYNPLNMIVDIRIRDVCEYFKFNFFNNVDIDDELNLFLTYNNFDIEEKKLFLARMLFPTYYFDLYEKIIANEVDEIEIKKIINKANEFEIIIQQIYRYFRNNRLMIEWLEN